MAKTKTKKGSRSKKAPAKTSARIGSARRGPKPRNLTDRVVICVTPTMRRKLKSVARKRGTKMSELVREAITETIARRSQRRSSSLHLS